MKKRQIEKYVRELFKPTYECQHCQNIIRKRQGSGKPPVFWCQRHELEISSKAKQCNDFSVNGNFVISDDMDSNLVHYIPNGATSHAMNLSLNTTLCGIYNEHTAFGSIRWVRNRYNTSCPKCKEFFDEYLSPNVNLDKKLVHYVSGIPAHGPIRSICSLYLTAILRFEFSEEKNKITCPRCKEKIEASDNIEKAMGG